MGKRYRPSYGRCLDSSVGVGRAPSDRLLSVGGSTSVRAEGGAVPCGNSTTCSVSDGSRRHASTAGRGMVPGPEPVDVGKNETRHPELGSTRRAHGMEPTFIRGTGNQRLPLCRRTSRFLHGNMGFSVLHVGVANLRKASQCIRFGNPRPARILAQYFSERPTAAAICCAGMSRRAGIT